MKPHITDDTRQVGKNSLFLKTPQNECFIESLPYDVGVIERDELKQYFNMQTKIIGITGTNGKTTTAAAIYSILLDMGYKVALLGTRGMFINEVQKKPKGLTTPGLLELYEDIDMAANDGCDFFVMEVSSHAIKQGRIYGLEFFLKILTNITSDHLDYHKTWEDYCKTKMQFLKSGDCPKIINLDDKNAAMLRFHKNVFTYGIESKGHFFVNAYGLRDGIFAQVCLRMPESNTKQDFNLPKDSNLSQNSNPSQECELYSHLFGLFNLYNLLAATLSVHILTKNDLKSICSCVQNFGGVSGRMEIVSKNPLVIVDFAHTTDGMKQVFEAFKTRNVSVVFGAGGDRDASKRQKMGACAATYAKKIYITNDNPRSEKPINIAQSIAKGVMLSYENESLDLNDCEFLENKAYIFHVKGKLGVMQIVLDRLKAIELALKELPQDWVLLVLGKGDESVQIFKNENFYFNDKESIQNLLSNA